MLASVFVSAVPAQANPESLQAQVQIANSRLGELQNELASVMEAFETASAELRETQAEIVDIEEQIEELEDDIAYSQELLGRQADFMYRSRGKGYLEILFAASNSKDFIRSLELVGFLVENDVQIIETLQSQTRQLEQSLNALADLQEEQEAVEAARKADVDAAQQLINEQQSYISSLNRQVQEALERQARAAREREAASRPSGNGGSNASSGNLESTGIYEQGIASFYWQGHTTANGERFDPNGMTTAHPTLPFGTMVRVTYQGRSVDLRVNDRGPFISGRIIDISRGAARVIGLEPAGIGHVTVEVLSRP